MLATTSPRLSRRFSGWKHNHNQWAIGQKNIKKSKAKKTKILTHEAHDWPCLDVWICSHTNHFVQITWNNKLNLRNYQTEYYALPKQSCSFNCWLVQHTVRLFAVERSSKFHWQDTARIDRISRAEKQTKRTAAT